MPADKTIFQCPVYTLYTQLNGAMRAVIQPSADAAADYGVPLSLLSQWILSNYQIGVYGGVTNPDPALGNNGDLYFQSTGQVKQKISGVWTFKCNLPTGGGSSAVLFKFDVETASNLTIAWQTDIPPGQTSTYAALLGNVGIKPVADLPTGVTNQKQRIPFDLKITTNDDESLITSVLLDWSVTYDLVTITF